MVAIRDIRGVLLMILCGLLIFMLLLTVRPQVTYACSCVVPAPPLEAMENSAAVFEGTVISIKKPFKLVQSSADPVQVTFQVGARWKGDLGEQVTVSTALSEDSCGFEFTKDERYFVYAREEAAEGGNEESTLTTSLCSRTTLYSGAQEDLNELGAGTGGVSPTAPPDIAEGDGAVAPDNNSTQAPTETPAQVPTEAPTQAPMETPTQTSTQTPWLLYAGAGAVILIALLLTWQRRQSNKSRK